MKYKLDDIDKGNIHKVPIGYFEDLPMKIQKRLEQEHKPSGAFLVTPKWALAFASIVLLVISSIFIFQSNQQGAEDLLAEVPQEDLVAYLEELNLDTDELYSAIPTDTDLLMEEDTDLLNGIELEEEFLDTILDEYDLEQNI